MELLAGSTTITGLNLTGWVPATIPVTLKYIPSLL
jgi:hypothetical protein